MSFPACAYDGWSVGKITSIRIQSYRILVTQAGMTNPGGCVDTSYLVIPQGDTPYLKNMYAALLTAYASGVNVQLALDGCQEDKPLVTQVWVR